jgi:hypothetical protein
MATTYEYSSESYHFIPVDSRSRPSTTGNTTTGNTTTFNTRAVAKDSAAYNSPHVRWQANPYLSSLPSIPTQTDDATHSTYKSSGGLLSEVSSLKKRMPKGIWRVITTFIESVLLSLSSSTQEFGKVTWEDFEKLDLDSENSMGLRYITIGVVQIHYNDHLFPQL